MVCLVADCYCYELENVLLELCRHFLANVMVNRYIYFFGVSLAVPFIFLGQIPAQGDTGPIAIMLY